MFNSHPVFPIFLDLANKCKTLKLDYETYKTEHKIWLDVVNILEQNRSPLSNWDYQIHVNPLRHRNFIKLEAYRPTLDVGLFGENYTR